MFETQINSEVRTGFVVPYEQKFVNFIINPGLSVEENEHSLTSVDRPIGAQVFIIRIMALPGVAAIFTAG